MAPCENRLLTRVRELDCFCTEAILRNGHCHRLGGELARTPRFEPLRRSRRGGNLWLGTERRIDGPRPRHRPLSRSRRYFLPSSRLGRATWHVGDAVAGLQRLPLTVRRTKDTSGHIGEVRVMSACHCTQYTETQGDRDDQSRQFSIEFMQRGLPSRGGERTVVDDLCAPRPRRAFSLASAGTGKPAIEHVEQAMRDVHRMNPNIRYSYDARSLDG